MTAAGARSRDVPADDQYGAFTEEGVDRRQHAPARQHQEQSQLLRRMGLACGAHALRARAVFLSESADGDRSVAVHDAGFEADLERRAGRSRRDTDRYRLDAILAWRRR